MKHMNNENNKTTTVLSKFAVSIMVTLLLLLANISAFTPDPGHPAEEIGAGTFAGGPGFSPGDRDYIFPSGSSLKLMNGFACVGAGNCPSWGSGGLFVESNIGIGVQQPQAQLHVARGIITGLTGFSSGQLTFFPLSNTGVWYHILNNDYQLAFSSGQSGASGNTVMTLSTSGDLTVDGHINAHSTTHVADIAEPFDLVQKDAIEEGDVVVIDMANPNKLKKSTKAYDTTVAGVISSPRTNALIAGSRRDGSKDKPLALAGRVYVKATSANGAVGVGDLLTTSNLPGHAMRCKDRVSCVGSVIGKALEPLEKGNGRILMLVVLG